MNDPDLVLLDEPTSGLDPIGRKEMKDLIIKLRDEGKTVVICSHLLPDVQDVCDRIAILYAGELKVLGKFEDLLKSQGETQLVTSQLGDEVIAEVKEVLARHGANLLKVDHPTTSLEDLFLSTVRESQERPGRRFVPEEEKAAAAEHWQRARIRQLIVAVGLRAKWLRIEDRHGSPRSFGKSRHLLTRSHPPLP